MCGKRPILCCKIKLNYAPDANSEEKVIEVEPTDTIQTVKEKLQEAEGTAVDQQRLKYQGKFLKNQRTIESYYLKNESIYQNWLHHRYQHLAVPQEITFLLESLRRKFQIGLITNGTSAAQWEKIDRLHLKGYFDLILVSGDLTYEKPDKNIFYQACERLNVNPKNCLMVGDKLETDILGGLEAGLAGTIWVPLNSHYILSESDPQPDYILRNVIELKHLLSSGKEFETKLAYLKSQGKREARLKKSRNSLLYKDISYDNGSGCSTSSDNVRKKFKSLQLCKAFCPEEDSNSNASDGS